MFLWRGILSRSSEKERKLVCNVYYAQVVRIERDLGEGYSIVVERNRGSSGLFLRDRSS